MIASVAVQRSLRRPRPPLRAPPVPMTTSWSFRHCPSSQSARCMRCGRGNTFMTSRRVSSSWLSAQAQGPLAGCRFTAYDSQDAQWAGNRQRGAREMSAAAGGGPARHDVLSTRYHPASAAAAAAGLLPAQRAAALKAIRSQQVLPPLRRALRRVCVRDRQLLAGGDGARCSEGRLCVVFCTCVCV